MKRRTDVGIFPNEAAITRLVGALLLGQRDEWSQQHRYNAGWRITVPHRQSDRSVVRRGQPSASPTTPRLTTRTPRRGTRSLFGVVRHRYRELEPTSTSLHACQGMAATGPDRLIMQSAAEVKDPLTTLRRASTGVSGALTLLLDRVQRLHLLSHRGVLLLQMFNSLLRHQRGITSARSRSSRCAVLRSSCWRCA